MYDVYQETSRKSSDSFVSYKKYGWLVCLDQGLWVVEDIVESVSP